ncbi:substrate-binding domain-containing protein [Demequina lignilytica]|uniref:Substrate-binding domain-containing protein n=1 Tax=Demequina lignilytica TaxID=3051663 RepID=A0AB35MK64_9MICO|nr:substrate-binding domain-containing protein [Demequina sp. SYSU T0a273]MDN4484142.1 substrate-binding domain-containing protein [Demequina sp. SYSU T0a273]
MRAISSMATRHVLADLLAAAADAGLPEVEVESVGGVDAARRVAEGEPFDLVFLADGALGRLADADHVDAATLTPLVVSEVAVAVPAPGVVAAEAPDGPAFPDAAAMREALLAAPRLGYSTGPSGTALVAMIERWGLAEELGGRLVQARPGIPVAASLAAGDVDLGCQQLSELAGQPGIRILGTLPDDCAITTVFAGAVATAAADPDGARAVLALLASDAVDAIKVRHSFAVPPRP